MDTNITECFPGTSHFKECEIVMKTKTDGGGGGGARGHYVHSVHSLVEKADVNTKISSKL